jgi:hypothetical protein
MTNSSEHEQSLVSLGDQLKFLAAWADLVPAAHRTQVAQLIGRLALLIGDVVADTE